jgi:branched-subunit amino acid aminotransferase/4-amino-4-deoxychorismate lyase
MVLPVYISRNGVLVPSAEAVVSVLTPALYGAYGVYESMKVVGGVPFEEAGHLRRLARSAEILALPLPTDLETFRRWIAEVLAAHGAPECTLRLFIVGPEDSGEAVAYIWPQQLPVYPREYYTEGAPAITFEGCRYLPQAKSLNSLVSFLAQRAARAAGVHESLLHREGFLTEGSNSNLFAVVGGVVLTPPARMVLAGVTRDLILTLMAVNSVPSREEPLPIAEMSRWEECFITSTSRHVMPVTMVDGKPVGVGSVGPVTRRLMALFEAYFAGTMQTADAGSRQGVLGSP